MYRPDSDASDAVSVTHRTNFDAEVTIPNATFLVVFTVNVT
jgi:hypothetical protein